MSPMTPHPEMHHQMGRCALLQVGFMMLHPGKPLSWQRFTFPTHTCTRAVPCSATAVLALNKPKDSRNPGGNTHCGTLCMRIQNVLRGAGRVYKTAATVFAVNHLDSTGDQRVSFVLAQKGSINRQYLLLGISHPLPGARLYVSSLALFCSVLSFTHTA